MNLQRFYVAICLVLLSTSLLAAIPANCDSIQQAKGYPEYYCDCKYDYTNFVLPLDTVVSYESIWLKGWVSDLYDGLSAYLHSDCDLNFEVYASCTAKEPRYQAIFTQNEASAIDGEAIKRKLEENQVGSLDVAFYICISPIGGKGGRLIMRKESDGMPSTCEDPLYMLPGMSLYSTQANDVYVVDPTELNELTDIILQWEPDMVSSCELQVTSGSCDGPTIAQTTLETDDAYVLPAADIRQALQDKENLYLHFSHAANKAGMVRCLAPIYEENYIDTLLCQGMGLAVHDTLLTEPTVYTIDTIYDYSNVYLINYYDLSFYEPDLQYDTLGLYESQLPYLYRGQFAVTDFVDYDITIHTPEACDEQYALHVYHKIDTITHVRDTALCYGAVFEHQGRWYSQDISFGSATWKNADTYLIDSLHVRFATTPEIVYDTIKVNQRKYGETFNTVGDFSFTYSNAGCLDSIILHVQASEDGVNYSYDYIDVELCQGLVYDEHWSGDYTSSVVLSDSLWNSNYDCRIVITTVTFIPPTPQRDTISIKSTALPYSYHGEKITEFGTHDITIHEEDECDLRYILTLLHDIDTLYATVDTTLCQGKIFTYDGVEYTQNTTFSDTLLVDADTYQISTITVSFTAPDVVSDTLSLKSVDLPYTYRNQYTVSDFGNYDVLITGTDLCDERYALVVLHDFDTLYTTVDTTLCQGKIFRYDGVEYTQNTTFCDTLSVDADTYQISTITVSFTAPDAVSDTLSLKSVDLPYTYRNQYTVSDFGNYDVLITGTDLCDERYALVVLHDFDTLYTTVDTTLCQGKIFRYDGVEYTQNTTFCDTLSVDADTYQISTITVSFTAPDAVSDTLSLKSVDLPYTYRNQYTVSDFGNYDVLITGTDLCDERYALVVLHDFDTLYTTVDTTLCQGKIFRYDGVEYTQNTTFCDTLSVDADTYQISTITVSFTAPDAVSDTLSLKSVDLPYTYRNQYTVSDFGNYDVLITGTDLCDERYALVVLHDFDTLYTTVDTTLCQGKIFRYDGVEYTQNTTFCDTLSVDADTYQISTITVSFTAPDAVSDTLSLKSVDLPYTYRNQYTVSDFGNYDVLITGTDLCDERYALVVLHDLDTLYTTVDTTLCQGKVYLYNEVEYTSSTAFVDSTWLNADTYSITSVTVTILSPEAVSDTLSLKSTDLPYTYRNQHTISEYGDYDLTIHVDGECDERYLLHVAHDVDTVISVVDTLLCYGATFELAGEEFVHDTILVQTEWSGADSLLIDTIRVAFALVPDQVYDTLAITPADLPYNYYEQLIPDFGDYEFMLYNAYGCLEQVLLHVCRTTTTDLPEQPLIDRPRLLMRNGIVYILRGSEVFTLLGEKVE